jgi:hypothetical protein
MFKAMEVSCEDLEVLKQGRECLLAIQKLLPPADRDTAPDSVVGALLSVCLQHCDSVLILLQTGENAASAEALLRPMVESGLRLLWLAEEKGRAKLVTAKKMNFPNFSRLLRILTKKTPPAKKTKPDNLSDAVNQLHDLTHAGMTQLAQHFEGADKQRTPLEVKLGLRLTAILVVVIAMVACGGFCSLTGRKKDLEQIALTFSVYLLRSSTDVLNILGRLDPAARQKTLTSPISLAP